MTRLFRSFFQGGFECSTHRRADGVRLDLIASSGHDDLVLDDYLQLSSRGIFTVRDGVRWHLIERSPGEYDWSSFVPMLRAAHAAGVQVIWDLCHYGYPDHVDIWSEDFVDAFGSFAREAAIVALQENDPAPLFCPINEISYWAWAGAQTGRINPVTFERGAELKRQLVRASIAAIRAIRSVAPDARFIVAEPLINVVSGSCEQEHVDRAEEYRQSQFEVHDMLTGERDPQLGGRPEFLDIVGVNFYPDNQWYLGGSTIPLGHHAYRPLHEMLHEVYRRYRRPLLISETGAEGRVKHYWLSQICEEVRLAIDDGLPVQGICLYPIVDYHGWDNHRICQVGLLSLPDEAGTRRSCELLDRELRRQQLAISRTRTSDLFIEEQRA
ncbi:beta-glucosidase [Steroidobacter sp. S1-65]|uniref:Beta-glucosidase n=1 Tax=Steroidobacter gossypii TaxID=2805490 RepID=A0ABS1WQA6_9GAMM|nr:beta-glucosidase [Steroidobacter gossypii]MBM0103132.1 beta-glucosidase [Steroidobacter gossypii]